MREDFGEFYRDYEMMGVQRHIKVLGIFARLYHRDGKDGYLKDMPLVMDYLRRACERYIDLKPLLVLLMELEMHAQQAGTSVLMQCAHLPLIQPLSPASGRESNRERHLQCLP